MACLGAQVNPEPLQAEFDGVNISPEGLGQFLPVHSPSALRGLLVFHKQRLVLVVGPLRESFWVALAQLFGLQFAEIQEIAQVEAFILVSAACQPIREVSGGGMVLDGSAARQRRTCRSQPE